MVMKTGFVNSHTDYRGETVVLEKKRLHIMMKREKDYHCRKRETRLTAMMEREEK